jgi:hypothetical protein
MTVFMKKVLLAGLICSMMITHVSFGAGLEDVVAELIKNLRTARWVIVPLALAGIIAKLISNNQAKKN